MADNLGLRQDSKYVMICTIPSIEYSVVWYPVPFPVFTTLGDAQDVSEDVFYNDCAAYKDDSCVEDVFADELGVNKGAIYKR